MVCACPSPPEKVGRALGMVVRPQVFDLKTLWINTIINVVMVFVSHLPKYLQKQEIL